jgi:predicted flap endonuclease-1-like 5' DNA nuclease
MLRWLIRLLIIALVLFVAVRVVSRMLGGEEDFEDYDDIDAGFEFTETPVEIDVPAEAAMSTEANMYTDTGSNNRQALIDISGIGPTYASRLMEAGINTLDDLARADAEELAERLDVIGGRATVQNWIMQAQGLSSGPSNS